MLFTLPLFRIHLKTKYNPNRTNAIVQMIKIPFTNIPIVVVHSETIKLKAADPKATAKFSSKLFSPSSSIFNSSSVTSYKFNESYLPTLAEILFSSDPKFNLQIYLSIVSRSSLVHLSVINRLVTYYLIFNV